MIVALIGLPGSGKSSAGRQLARQLTFAVVDTDQQIESRIGMPIRDFFSVSGEDRFRDIESEVLEQCLSADQSVVLATGGGIVLRERNRELLRQHAKVFYLRTSIQELARRLRNDTVRPLLQDTDPVKKLRELYAVRDPLYRQTCHYVVEAHRPSVASLVQWMQMQLELGGHLVLSAGLKPLGQTA